MPTTFAKTKDRFSTTLASPHAIGDGILVLAAGAAASLGAPGANRVWRVTATTNPDTAGEVVLAQFDATGVSGNNLTGVTATTGYSDVVVPSGTPIRIRWTKRHVDEIQDALNTAETNIALAALDADVVHKTGTETIGPAKTFDGVVTISATGPNDRAHLYLGPAKFLQVGSSLQVYLSDESDQADFTARNIVASSSIGARGGTSYIAVNVRAAGFAQAWTVYSNSGDVQMYANFVGGDKFTLTQTGHLTVAGAYVPAALADADIPNGGIAWSTTTPNALKCRTPAGVIKTVTLT